MTRKIIRAGIIAAFAVGAVVTAVPAHAYPVGPGGEEYQTTYYSSPTHVTVVGVVRSGSCGYSATGTTSAYSTTIIMECPY